MPAAGGASPCSVSGRDWKLRCTSPGPGSSSSSSRRHPHRPTLLPGSSSRARSLPPVPLPGCHLLKSLAAAGGLLHRPAPLPTRGAPAAARQPPLRLGSSASCPGIPPASALHLCLPRLHRACRQAVPPPPRPPRDFKQAVPLIMPPLLRHRQRLHHHLESFIMGGHYQGMQLCLPPSSRITV